MVHSESPREKSNEENRKSTNKFLCYEPIAMKKNGAKNIEASNITLEVTKNLLVYFRKKTEGGKLRTIVDDTPQNKKVLRIYCCKYSNIPEKG